MCWIADSYLRGPRLVVELRAMRLRRAFQIIIAIEL